MGVLNLEVFLGLDLVKHIKLTSKDEVTPNYVFIEQHFSLSSTPENLKRLKLCGNVCHASSNKKLYIFELSGNLWQKICKQITTGNDTFYQDWFSLYPMQ